MSRTRSSLAMVALLAVLMLLSVALPVAAQDGAGRDLSGLDAAGEAVISSDINVAAAKRANGTISVIVKLASAPSYRDFNAAGGRDNRGFATSAAQTRDAQLRAEQDSFSVAATALGGRITNRFQFLLNAVVVEIAPDRVLSLAKIPGVVAIGPNRTYAREHTTSMPLVRASDVWNGTFTGGSYTGAGVTVAVIDEGIDYSHADFGGNQNYAGNDPLVITDNFSGFPPSVLPNTATRQMKVIGGYDYVGDNYDAASAVPAELIAVPDPDPMGCPYAHGTHVAGTIAGYGVDAAGATFAGAYTPGDALFPSYPNASTATWRIGPGAAPEAYLVSLRVFGCSGSVNTDILLLSFEAAGINTYLGEDVDVLNLSLGSAYGGGGPDDFLNGAQQALANLGVVVVASAGNSGDFLLVHGAPSSAPSTISVANVTDSAAIVNGQLSYVNPVGPVIVNIPAAKAVSMYTTAMPDPLTANIVIANVANGCTALLPATYTGKWVVVDRGTCAFSAKVANVKAAGGAGAIIANNQAGAPFGPSQSAGFDDQLPTAMISQSDGIALKAAINAGMGPVSATFNGTIDFVLPEVALVPSGSTSRGGVLRGNNDLILKPNISGPGTTITSAGAGTNDLGYTISGTSMSSPHIAGGVALLIDATTRPANAAGVALIKQRLMNTATTDMFNSEVTSFPFHSPQRVGAGFADFVAAINTNLVAFATDSPENTSLSFGYPRALVNTTPSITKTITVSNLSASPMILNTGYSPRSDWGGAVFSVSPATLSLAANSSTTINVTLTLIATQSNLNVGGDPLFLITGKTILHEESGYVTLTPTSGSQTAIRVAVYAAPHLTSDITADNEVVISGDTGLSYVTLSGDGFDLGPDANDHLSLTSAYTLLATDPVETGFFWDADGSGGPDDPAEALTDYSYADIEYVGASLLVSGTTTFLDVGIKTHGEWNSPRDLFVEVYVDVNNDATDDYVWFYGSAASDSFSVSFQSLLEASASSFGSTLNYAAGASVDSMLLKNNVMSIPVRVKSPSFNNVNRPNYVSGPIGITVVTYQRDSDFSFPIDVVQGSYTPDILFTPTFLRNLYPALDGEVIPFTYNVTGLVSLPEIMTIHHQNNGAASRVQITSLAQITGSSFTLSSPANGTVFRDASDASAATWSELVGASSYTFTLTQTSVNTGIGMDASGDQTIVTGTAIADSDQITCAASVCTINLSAFALEDGIYSWSVTAGEAPNLVEASNNAYTFTVETNDYSLAITQSSGTTAVVEGGATDTLSIMLNSVPMADVTVTLSGGTQVTVAPSPLTFNSLNWDTPQVVTVTAVNDLVGEASPHAGAVSYTIASADTDYSALIVADTAVSITDNDTAGVTIVQSDGTTLVVEAGATDSYTVVLTSEPTADVTVTLSGGTQVTVAPSPLTFTSLNWNTAQTVTVTAVDDSVVEGIHAGAVSSVVTSTDLNYNAMVVADVAVSITDGLSSNLILNGGFETAGITPKKALDWTGTGVRKILPLTAPQAGLAYMRVPDNKQVKQTLTVTNQPALAFFVAGDVLDLDFFVKNGKRKLANITVTYADATIEKCVILPVINTPPAKDWEAEGLTCDLNGPVTQIVVRLKHSGGPQIVATSYDSVTLVVQSPGRVIDDSLPLPAAPDGFRGNE